jgi:glycosyltransferase involved in cell wall biosynthesis
VILLKLVQVNHPKKLIRKLIVNEGKRMHPEKKIVSIIIPTYKRSDFLFRAVDSALNQTYKNIEIIIVDDNGKNSIHSTENLKKLEKYKDDIRIIYHINEENLGCALARNEGIKLSKGEYVTFLDDDDIYLPEKVEKQISLMIEKNLDMSFTELRLHNENDILIDYRSFEDIKKFEKNYLKKYHLMKHITGTDTFMYKRDFILTIGGFDSKNFGDEFYLMYKTINKDAKIGYLKESYVIAYVHKHEGISKGSTKILGEKDLYNFKKTQYHSLTLNERQFVKFRHFVVLSISYIRNKSIFLALYYGLLAFLFSPFDALKETLKLRKKLKKYNDINLKSN